MGEIGRSGWEVRGHWRECIGRFSVQGPGRRWGEGLFGVTQRRGHPLQKQGTQGKKERGSHSARSPAAEPGSAEMHGMLPAPQDHTN